MTIVIYYVDINDKGKIMISTITFRNNVNKFWYDWVDWIEDYTSLTGGGENTSILFFQINRSILRFYEEVKSVYGRTAADRISTCILGMFEGLSQAKALIENGIDPQPITDRVKTTCIDVLATVLSNLNSEWSREVITPIFLNIWNAWLDHSRAILANDIVAADAEESKALLNSLAFADAFVNGAIKQYNPIFF